MKKVLIISLLALIAVISLASCSDKPDPALLPEPEISFKAVKATLGTGIRIDLVNMNEAMRFSSAVKIECAVADAESNILFSEAYGYLDGFHTPITTIIEDVPAGETLTCTVTYKYEDVAKTATATDIVV